MFWIIKNSIQLIKQNYMKRVKNIIKLLHQKNFRIYALDELLKEKTNLYNIDKTINKNCKRTEIGQLHYDLKINNKKENIPLISNKIIDFLKELEETFDIIIPIPSKSNNNTNIICSDISQKTNILLINNIRYINNDFIILNEQELKNKKILLIDDTYNTGKTLKNIYSKIKHLSNNITAITFVINK